VPQKHFQISSAQKSIPTGLLFAPTKHAQGKPQRFSHLPSLQFFSLYKLPMFYKQARSTVNALAVVNQVRKFPRKNNLLREPEENSSGKTVTL